MKLKRLRKTANHLKFLRYCIKQVGDNDNAGCRLIMASGDRYYTVRQMKEQIQQCKQMLREGLRKKPFLTKEQVSKALKEMKDDL